MTSSNQHSDINVADGYPQSVGRGSGMTLREMNRRLKDGMRRLGITSLSWSQRARARVRAREAAEAAQAKCVEIRIRKTDGWSLL